MACCEFTMPKEIKCLPGINTIYTEGIQFNPFDSKCYNGVFEFLGWGILNFNKDGTGGHIEIYDTIEEFELAKTNKKP